MDVHFSKKVLQAILATYKANETERVVTRYHDLEWSVVGLTTWLTRLDETFTASIMCVERRWLYHLNT